MIQKTKRGRARPARHCGLDPQSRGVGCAGQQQYTTTINIHSPIKEEESKPVPVPDTGAKGENDAPASSRHCGLDPQSRGEGAGNNTNQHRPVILASRQYPQGGVPPIPLSLDERRPKHVSVPDTGAEGENDAPASSRHCGLDPQSRGEGAGNNTNQHRPVILASRQYPQGGVPPIPLSLDERRPKHVSVPDTGAESEQDPALSFPHPTPSFPRRRESTGRGCRTLTFQSHNCYTAEVCKAL